MVEKEHFDVRTITMGISLLDCCDSDPEKACEKIYNKITRLAGNLVKTGCDIEKEYGIHIGSLTIENSNTACKKMICGTRRVHLCGNTEYCLKLMAVSLSAEFVNIKRFVTDIQMN